jgi:hypothetical protein
MSPRMPSRRRPEPPSFLWVVCHELLGPPAVGQSCWYCPYCNDTAENPEWASFSVRPARRNPNTGRPYPIKFKCHRCKAWGDEYDVIGLLYEGMSYQARQVEIARLQEYYRREYLGVGSGSVERTSPLGDYTPAGPVSGRGIDREWLADLKRRLAERAISPNGELRQPVAKPNRKGKG